MCVAIIVEGSISTDTLLSCEDNNPHGAGLAWGDGDRVRYRKGLTAMEVVKIAQALPRPFLLHFRWATHGGRAAHLTHPFPLGHRALISRSLEGVADAVLIHNGVWGDYERFIPQWVDRDRWSDTAVAAYVAGTTDESILDHVAWSTAVARAAGSGRLDITTRGRWYEHSDGNSYSNLSWLPRPAPRYSIASAIAGSSWLDRREAEMQRRHTTGLACQTALPGLDPGQAEIERFLATSPAPATSQRTQAEVRKATRSFLDRMHAIQKPPAGSGR